MLTRLCGIKSNQEIRKAMEEQRFKVDSFYHEAVADWNYFGNPPKLNLNLRSASIKTKNHIYHEVKHRSGGKNIHVDVERDPDTETVKLHYKIFELTPRGKQTYLKHFATIHVANASRENDIYFFFGIDNEELATRNGVTVQTLRQVCEIVFKTVVMRCQEQLGLSPDEKAAEETARISRLLQDD